MHKLHTITQTYA